jgi:adenosine deaminase
MTDQVAAFIDGLPKAELHLHLEGTLARNSFQIAWLTPADRAPCLAALDAYLRSRRTRCPPGRTV